MCKYRLQIVTVFVLVLARCCLGSHRSACPRHRGLPEAFTRHENTIANRALYRLDLRHALKGYQPGEIYRIRVHTTSRKHKFNDATVVLDAVEPACGVGRWIVDSDELYSPTGCPDIVTTQQKEPMGRAHFQWQAPSCGCVHFRVRIHSNSAYYLEDVKVNNGPLARTICPQAGSVAEPSPGLQSSPKPTLSVKQMTRDERLGLLCIISAGKTTDDIVTSGQLVARRTIGELTAFQLDQLNIAIHHRQSHTSRCCALSGPIAMYECFGDVRRRRIDTFCAIGQPDVPFAKETFDWLTGRRQMCCSSIE